MWLNLDPMLRSNLHGVLKIAFYIVVLMVYATLLFYTAYLFAGTQIATDFANAYFGR